MYDQIREDTFFIMLYAVVMATALLASCYLLFRRANAIAPDVTPPARMLGAEKDVKESAEAEAFRELLLKYNLEQ